MVDPIPKITFLGKTILKNFEIRISRKICENTVVQDNSFKLFITCHGNFVTVEGNPFFVYFNASFQWYNYIRNQQNENQEGWSKISQYTLVWPYLGLGVAKVLTEEGWEDRPRAHHHWVSSHGDGLTEQRSAHSGRVKAKKAFAAKAAWLADYQGKASVLRVTAMNGYQTRFVVRGEGTTLG